MGTAAALDVSQDRTTERPPLKHPAKGKRLSQLQLVQILNLHKAGKNNTEIAGIVGCDDSTVGSVLNRFGADTRDLARAALEAGAVKLAQTVVKTKDSAVALKTLGKLDVVREDQAGAGTNILIAMGQPGSALEPPAISISPLSPRIESVSALSPASEIAVSVDRAEAKATPIEGVSPADVA